MVTRHQAFLKYLAVTGFPVVTGNSVTGYSAGCSPLSRAEVDPVRSEPRSRKPEVLNQSADTSFRQVGEHLTL